MQTVLSIAAATLVVAAVTRHHTPSVWTLGTCVIIAFMNRRTPWPTRSRWLAAATVAIIMLVFWYGAHRVGILK